MNKRGSAGNAGRGGWFRQDSPEETMALDDADHESHHEQIRALAGKPDVGTPSDDRE